MRFLMYVLVVMTYSKVSSVFGDTTYDFLQFGVSVVDYNVDEK